MDWPSEWLFYTCWRGKEIQNRVQYSKTFTHYRIYICTLAHLHICTLAHLHICTFSSYLQFMPRICLFPGTFDPVTLGHVDIIKRAIPLFDKIIVAVGINSSKMPMFSPEQRMQWIEEIFRAEPSIEGAVYEGLTIDFCNKVGARFILRGIRYVSDFEYEKTIADANRTMDPNIETIFLTGEPKYTSVASTIVRDIIKNGGDASPFLPDAVVRSIRK
jgi:pantetheine-phosphate adenylyltransferase